MTLKKVLTIAGSDSSGGAGIQADLKTFQELGVYGMTALTTVVTMDPNAIAAELGKGKQVTKPLQLQRRLSQKPFIMALN